MSSVITKGSKKGQETSNLESGIVQKRQDCGHKAYQLIHLVITVLSLLQSLYSLF